MHKWYETTTGYETKNSLGGYKGVIARTSEGNHWEVWVVDRNGTRVGLKDVYFNLDDAKNAGGYLIKDAVQRQAVESMMR